MERGNEHRVEVLNNNINSILNNNNNNNTEIKLINDFFDIFDPTLAFAFLFLTIYQEIYLFGKAPNGDINLISCFGIFSCSLIYMQILLTYSIFKKIAVKYKRPSHFFCCSLAMLCRKK